MKKFELQKPTFPLFKTLKSQCELFSEQLDRTYNFRKIIFGMSSL